MEEKFKLDRQTIALRAAKEFQDGDSVNLGIGIPVLCANYIPAGREVLFQSENGILGFGELTAPGEGDPDLLNASGQTVHTRPGMSCFGHAESFTMIRGGHLDVSVMGGFQVSEKGDLANYMVPERKIGVIGGAMDLAYGAKRTYPITTLECVNLVITDIAVIEVTDKRMVLKEVAPGWTPAEVQHHTEPVLIVAPDCHEIELM
jgi:acyl CoA:acetate/3-ketoacid CoA transferase beta subunit